MSPRLLPGVPPEIITGNHRTPKRNTAIDRGGVLSASRFNDCESEKRCLECRRPRRKSCGRGPGQAARESPCKPSPNSNRTREKPGRREFQVGFRRRISGSSNSKTGQPNCLAETPAGPEPKPTGFPKGLQCVVAWLCEPWRSRGVYRDLLFCVCGVAWPCLCAYEKSDSPKTWGKASNRTANCR